ncbi:hypothetical protein PVAG01_05111 [Phlyctema vagabunda]|uniref:Uncharacterized protein n=1 Tax=Phlyctema vagabunda TaxID=108571 RepID=A0ABR4PJ39_9HELO
MMLIWSSAKASATTETFTFTFCPVPSIKFTFDQSSAACYSPYRPFKRRRALSDVDGGGSEGRKKRRLRLHLITSRLSRPFSQPASNIVNRGSSKIAAWSRNKAIGRTDLRKAAIMNRVRLSMDAAKNVMRQEQERSRGLLALRQIMVQKPRFHDMPLPPSPLGLSNYDALDLEDEMTEEDEDGEGGIQRTSSIYSDFNIMNPVSDEGDEYEYLDAIDGLQPEDCTDVPPPPPEDDILEILREKERHGDGHFLRCEGQ